ncbi:hypothetical protein OZ656_06255 [Marinobacter sp. LM1]|uniref:hypothetical protein n=1 Tax=Marinobacter sp. LM1 TaxID=3003349 RepID=UPI0036D27866
MTGPMFISERSDEQAEMFAKLLPKDVYTLLRLFENYRGIDLPQGWQDLLQVYHSVFEDPDKRPKTSWRPDRLRKALDKAQELGLIELQRNHHWMITPEGLKARKAETVRRMKG